MCIPNTSLLFLFLSMNYRIRPIIFSIVSTRRARILVVDHEYDDFNDDSDSLLTVLYNCWLGLYLHIFMTVEEGDAIDPHRMAGSSRDRRHALIARDALIARQHQRTAGARRSSVAPGRDAIDRVSSVAPGRDGINRVPRRSELIDHELYDAYLGNYLTGGAVSTRQLLNWTSWVPPPNGEPLSYIQQEAYLGSACTTMACRRRGRSCCLSQTPTTTTPAASKSGRADRLTRPHVDVLWLEEKMSTYGFMLHCWFFCWGGIMGGGAIRGGNVIRNSLSHEVVAAGWYLF